MSLLEEARDLKNVIIEHRRYLHENAEIGLDLPVTSAYVKTKLEEMGYETKTLGSSGIVATAGGKKSGKTFLLRADMDALPILEENNLLFKSKTKNMHACGHDFHTSMLLGAAQLLKKHEDEIQGQVKLMYQPAEEILAGAQMMIKKGVLEDPKVDAAMMMHVFPGIPLSTGSVMFTDSLPFAAVDCFIIKINGKGCHGAIPNDGVDPLNVASHIHIALQAINSREVPPIEPLVVTVGEISGGNAFNVIPDTAHMKGTIRTFKNSTREFVKKRLEEIVHGVSTAFRASSEVIYESGSPSMVVDEKLQNEVEMYTREMLGADNIIKMDELNMPKMMGSEDFSYISLEVPAICVMLGAGSPAEGYLNPLHHPKVLFNEEALTTGCAVYANSAIQWLKNNK